MAQSPGASYLERLIRHVGAAEQVTAAYVGGPLASDQSDKFAELDLYLIAPATFHAELANWLRPVGEAAHIARTPAGCKIVTADGLSIDVVVGAGVPVGMKPIFDRGSVAVQAEEQPAITDLAEATARFWHDLYQAGASLGRGLVLSTHGDLERCRVHLLNLYRLALAPGQGGAGWAGAELLPGSEVLDRLTEWLVVPLDLRAQWRCAHRLATTYESLVLPLAQRLGLDYPWAMRNLAFERLEQVKPQQQPLDEPGIPKPAPEPEPAPRAPGPLRAKVKIRRPEA